MNGVLLDAYCCAGGASRGYVEAGWRVVGVDKDPQPNYPYDFHQADALTFLVEHGWKFDAVHTSPPCQRWTHGNVAGDQAEKHPDYLAPTRDLLKWIGVPYVIENVPRAPMENPVTLCGTMFGLTTVDDDGTTLHLKRHRQFESSHFLYPPRPCAHPADVQWAGAYGGARRDKHEARHIRKGGYVPPFPVLQRLMGIDWMTERELFQALPPVYTRWLGEQLSDAMRAAA